MKKENKIELRPLMSEEEMQQFIDANMHLVTPRTKQKFESWSLSSKFDYIQKRLDWEKGVEEARENAKLENQVKKLLLKKKANANDVHAVICMCQEYIEEMRKEEIDNIDAEIKRLQELKKTLEA